MFTGLVSGQADEANLVKLGTESIKV